MTEDFMAELGHLDGYKITTQSMLEQDIRENMLVVNAELVRCRIHAPAVVVLAGPKSRVFGGEHTGGVWSPKTLKGGSAEMCNFDGSHGTRAGIVISENGQGFNMPIDVDLPPHSTPNPPEAA